MCIGERIRRFNKSYFRGPSKKRKSTIFETANYLLHVTGACFATVGITAATYLEQDKEIFPSMWITIAAAIIFLTVSELGRASGDPYWHPLALLPTWNPNRLSVTTRSVPIEKVNYFTALEVCYAAILITYANLLVTRRLLLKLLLRIRPLLL